jgi:hypothetical protein
MPEHPLFPRMEKIAPDLGAVMIFWAWLDHLLADIIGELAGFEDRRLTEVLSGNADIRAKIQIAKGFAFIKQRVPGWFAEVVAVLNWIDGDIRTKRNDYAHARWSRKGRGHTITKHKTTITKPQAFQVALLTEDRKPVTARDVRRLVVDMRLAFFDLFFLFDYALKTRQAAEADPSSRPISYERYLRLAGHAGRLKRTRSARRRPPRS